MLKLKAESVQTGACTVKERSHSMRHRPKLQTCSADTSCSRRAMILSQTACLLTAKQCVLTTNGARAALAQFPSNRLNNRYYLVRAGEAYSESFGEPFTNPVWKTSARHGLSDMGKKQVLLGLIPALESLGACTDGCWLWPSITQNCYQTAEVLAFELGLGRNRIVPEYSFLDARGVGALENIPLDKTLEQLQQGDALDAAWKPPPGTDGTPNESSQDVLVRMRQVLSVTETQYSGEDVIFIAPDSDTLSVLQAAVLGVDLRAHGRYAFRPGEVRQLQLSTETWDSEPIRLSCPDPPKCTQRGA